MTLVKSDLSELTAINQKLGIERDTLRRIVCNLSGVISHGLDISPPKLSSVDLEYFIDCMISSLVSKKSQLQSPTPVTSTQVSKMRKDAMPYGVCHRLLRCDLMMPCPSLFLSCLPLCLWHTLCVSSVTYSTSLSAFPPSPPYFCLCAHCFH